MIQCKGKSYQTIKDLITFVYKDMLYKIGNTDSIYCMNTLFSIYIEYKQSYQVESEYEEDIDSKKEWETNVESALSLLKEFMTIMKSYPDYDEVYALEHGYKEEEDYDETMLQQLKKIKKDKTYTFYDQLLFFYINYEEDVKVPYE